MILPLEPDQPMSELEYRETLIGLAMISKARGYGIEAYLSGLATFVEHLDAMQTDSSTT